MNKKALRWLYEELPELVGGGIISADAERKIHEHYGEIEKSGGRSIALTVCGILGAVLIGAGIILILAHNWDDLSRPARTVLSLAPLIISQIIGLWILQTGRESAAWREGTAAFLALSIGSSIALVGQTYHIPGDFGNFMLTWMLLALPVTYLLGATIPCIIYFAGITTWAGYQQSQDGYAVFFWPLLALTFPYMWMEARKDCYSQRSVILGWMFSICLCVGTGVAMEHTCPGLWIIVYSALFPLLYLIGSQWFADAPSAMQKPFHSVGVIGTVVLSFLFTFEFPWKEIGFYNYHCIDRYHEYAGWVDYGLAVILPFCALLLLAMAIRKGDKSKLLFGVLPVLAILGFATSADAAMALFNVYLFVIGIRTLVVGIRNGRIWTVNAGMLILTALIIARFFDNDIGFVVRGIAFILIGAGFLITNVILIKRGKRGVQ